MESKVLSAIFLLSLVIAPLSVTKAQERRPGAKRPRIAAQNTNRVEAGRRQGTQQEVERRRVAEANKNLERRRHAAAGDDDENFDNDENDNEISPERLRHQHHKEERIKNARAGDHRKKEERIKNARAGEHSKEEEIQHRRRRAAAAEQGGQPVRRPGQSARR